MNPSHHADADADAGADWTVAFNAARRFAQTANGRPIPSSARVEGFPVGGWVARQRAAYWHGQLTPTQVTALEGLPGWTWAGPEERAWRARLDAAREWLASHDGAPLPQTLTVGKLRIGRWAGTQRASYRAGQLPAPLVERLESLPGWQWTTEFAEPSASPPLRWDEVLAQLRAYLATHTVGSITQHTVVNNFPLGRWLRHVRQDYRDGNLTDEQVDRFEQVEGWSWDPGQDEWKRGIAHLREWATSNGTADPPQTAVVEGFPLGHWVHNRRRQHRNGTLPVERARELETLPGWSWDTYDTAWLRGLTALRVFISEYGHSLVPVRYTVGSFGLGQWVREQRRKYRDGTLRDERRRALEEIADWTWTRDQPHAIDSTSVNPVEHKT